ncbi:SIMPL domain-containing protein [Sneathiella sp.]|uniref:SIMPL domain-containing protein n=1 Tax=Sneathiella sp. TaxID=1964365 RepID=UPI002FE3F1EC
MNRLVIATVAFLALAPMAAAADMPHPRFAMQDQVILDLTNEGWVKTDTARVTVLVELVQQEQSGDDLKKRIDASLLALAKDVDWRITSSRQQLDQTGLNRWYVTAEARIPEAAIDGLQDRAKESSTPGYKVSIADVDFTPSLEEFEALRADLRSKLYQQALDEVERLNKVMPGAGYHVKRVDFVQAGPMPMHDYARAQPMMKAAMAAESAPSGGGGAELLVSVKQSVSARVVLARTDDPAAKDD